MDLLQLTKYERGYILRLANGQGWHLIASEGIRSLVEKLASIMKLTKCEPNGYPKLIFIEGESGKEENGEFIRGLDVKTLERIPNSGWKAQNLKVLQLWFHCSILDVVCEIGTEDNHEVEIIRMWLAVNPIYQRAQQSGGLPFHAALIERNGIGIILAGHGGAGKSTCCQRLPSSWKTLCDDETLIVRDDQKRYFAHPFPTWSDYLWKRSERTWNVQGYLPLSAIFFLEQGGNDEAFPIGQGQAAILINQLATDVCRRSWRNLDREEERMQRKQLFENASELAPAVPAFKLRVSLTGHFWEKIEAVLR